MEFILCLFVCLFVDSNDWMLWWFLLYRVGCSSLIECRLLDASTVLDGFPLTSRWDCSVFAPSSIYFPSYIPNPLFTRSNNPSHSLLLLQHFLADPLHALHAIHLRFPGHFLRDLLPSLVLLHRRRILLDRSTLHPSLLPYASSAFC